MKEIEKYVAIYFKNTHKISKKYFEKDKVLIQFFQWNNNIVLAGITEILRILKNNTDINKYKIKHKKDGDIINAKDVVLELEGPYHEFGKYEGIIDGILSRASSVATNAKRIKDIANNKKIIFMGDRSDYYLNQELDGYAASIGGIKTQVTEAHISKHEGEAVGTIPHALIQMNQGDIIETLKKYKETIGLPLIALVDFNNDVIGDSIKALKEFKKDLIAVRVDTSNKISDAYFKNNEELGVTSNLIKALRKELDKNKGSHVKIIVSGGFDFEKIKDFEKNKTPVDIYGVGKSLTNIFINFTGDAVKFNEKYISKVGRKYKKINYFF